jgi:hypothetical protein
MVYVIKQNLIELGPKLIAYNLLYRRICSIKVFNHVSKSDYVERISKSSKANLGSGKGHKQRPLLAFERCLEADECLLEDNFCDFEEVLRKHLKVNGLAK